MIRHLVVLRSLVVKMLETAGRFPEDFHEVIETAKLELDYVDICLETLLAELADTKS
jgi:hypothetical protein